MPRIQRTALLAAGITLLFLARPAHAEDANLEEARKHFRAGIAYLEDPEGARYEDAYAEFKKTFEISKSPKVLGNIGLCAMKLERDGEAIEAYKRYLEQVPDIDPEERAQIERDLSTLRASVVELQVTLDVRTKVKPQTPQLTDTRIPVRGENIVNMYRTGVGPTVLAVRPGHHRISVNLDGHSRSGLWEFTVEPGTRLAHTFVIDEAPVRDVKPVAAPSAQPSYTGPVLLMGLGGAALAAGGVLGVMSLQKEADLEDQCPQNACSSPSYRDDVDDARGFVRAADYLFVGGGVVAAVGFTWFLLTPSAKSQEAAPVRATAGCNGRGCEASLRMRF
jgi:hypothetical protein